MLATPALAGSAYIQQLGANAAPRAFDYRPTELSSTNLLLDDIEQTMGTLNSSLAQFEVPVGGLSLISQSGDANLATISQQGQHNLGIILQSGSLNAGSIQQVGNNHHAMIYQNGSHNTAVIQQR